MVENEREKIPCDLVDKLQKKAVVMDLMVPSDRNIKEKKRKELQKYQGLKKEAERMWTVKATVGTGALRDVSSKLADVAPAESRTNITDLSTQKSSVLGLLDRTLKLPHLC